MNSDETAWVPVLAPLLSIIIDQESPDQVLNDFMAVGFNFLIPQELENRYEPRKRAYVSEVQRWIHELDWTAQWELARALAIRLCENRAHLVRQRLEAVGWRLDGTSFVELEAADIRREAFFPAGAVHDAFVHIRSLFKGATHELFVIDGYVDSSLFPFLLSTNGPRACRVLTKARSLPQDFVTESKRFVAQHGFNMAVRTSDAFHDRQIIVDGKSAFVLGASIKDAGKRAFNITPIETPSVRAEMIRYAESVWTDAQQVL